MGNDKLLDPKNDYAFKQIFGTEKNKDILIRFLNDMHPFSEDVKVTDVAFLPPVLDPEVIAKKQSIVDVLCKDEQGNQYIVEMQVASTKGFEKRAQYYAAKAYANQMKQGDAYHDLKEIIFLAITDFVMFPEIEDYKTDHQILENKTKKHFLKDFYFSFLELPKFNKKPEELTTTVEKWAYFFKYAPRTDSWQVDQVVGADSILQKAYTALNQYYWKDEEIAAYEAEQKRKRDEQAVYAQKEDEGEARGFAKGKEEGMAEGEAIGKAKEALRLARQFLDLGVSMEDIQKATGLTVEEILALHTFPYT